MMAPADAARRGQLLVRGGGRGVVVRRPGAAGGRSDVGDPGGGTRGCRGDRAARLPRVRADGAGRAGCAVRSVGRAGLVVAVCLAIRVVRVHPRARAHDAWPTCCCSRPPRRSGGTAGVARDARGDPARAPGSRWPARSLGVAIMIGGSLDSGGLWGDVLCLVMSGGFAVVIVITRRHREISMTPATALGMAIAFAATAPFSHIGGVSGRRPLPARRARRRPDRARADPLHGRSPPHPGRAGRPDHADRDRARAALGVADLPRGAGYPDDRRRLGDRRRRAAACARRPAPARPESARGRALTRARVRRAGARASCR